MTDKERLEAYMKLSKEELAKMLIESEKALKSFPMLLMRNEPNDPFKGWWTHDRHIVTVTDTGR